MAKLNAGIMSSNSIQDDFNFLKGASDRINSLIEKNVSGVKKFSAEIVAQMEEINLKICQIMDRLDDEPLNAQLKEEWMEKILTWEE